MSHGPLPTVLAWLVADHAYRDQVSKRCYILGTYSALGSLAYPFTHPGLHAYAALTELRGLTPLRVRLVDADEEGGPLWVYDTAVNSPDPLAVADLVFVSPPVTFPAPGQYLLQLYGAGQLLCERRIMAVLVPQQARQEGQA
jgi:hypothetical protein